MCLNVVGPHHGCHLLMADHAGQQIVVEEFLHGQEASFFALVAGRTCLPLGSAQVHPAPAQPLLLVQLGRSL